MDLLQGVAPTWMNLCPRDRGHDISPAFENLARPLAVLLGTPNLILGR
jgi:hypothetical protein